MNQICGDKGRFRVVSLWCAPGKRLFGLHRDQEDKGQQQSSKDGTECFQHQKQMNKE